MNNAYPVDEFYGTVYRRFAEFVRAYDGDSITINADLGDKLKFYHRAVRLYGVDTPEKAPKWKGYTDSDGVRLEAERNVEKTAALEALARVEAYVAAADNVLVVQTIKRPGKPLYDKYGRILGRVWVPINGVMLDLSEQLLNELHARPYFGGTKPPWKVLRLAGVADPSPEEVAERLLEELSATS